MRPGVRQGAVQARAGARVQVQVVGVVAAPAVIVAVAVDVVSVEGVEPGPGEARQVRVHAGRDGAQEVGTEDRYM